MAPNNTNKGKSNRGARSATPVKPGRQKTERPRRVAGAHSAQTSLRDRFISWRQHHRDSLRDALQRLNAARASSAMTILVIAIALALPAGLAVLLDNARAITRGWDGNAHLSVFLDMDISEARQRALAEEWQGTENITRTEVITRAQALAEFKALSGFGDVLEALPDNPLPPLIVVFPDSTDPVTLRALENRLGDADGVDLVQLDVEWVRRLHALIEIEQDPARAVVADHRLQPEERGGPHAARHRRHPVQGIETLENDQHAGLKIEGFDQASIAVQNPLHGAVILIIVGP